MRTKNSRAHDAIESAYIADVKRVSSRQGWFAERFNEYPNRVHRKCIICGRSMWLPPCKVQKYKTCGGECARAKHEPLRAARRRCCAACGKEFVPRQYQLTVGSGKFCSITCNNSTSAARLNTDDARKRSEETRAGMRARGEINYRSGIRHKNWRGGREAARHRGLDRARQYRRNNLDRVKAYEHNSRVRRRNAGKLASDTVERLKKLQSGRCAICKEKLGKFHLDHVIAVAKGGKNEFHNVQLLCVSCNLRKSDKDPIAFMQSRGFLL